MDTTSDRSRAAARQPPGGRPQVVFDFVVENGRILEISLIADRQQIEGMQLSID